ncbi:MAG TPA: C45 family peptidase [Cytophagaceae bacterium]|nr:C45 family peptidase [Cytophagaceae bacterium]
MLKYTALFLLLLIVGVILYFNFGISIDAPAQVNLDALKLERQQKGNNFYVLKNNWLRKNQQGIWEMYLEGEAFERGVVHGKLAKELVIKQEDDFVGEIKKIIPSEFYLKFLKYFILWFNRDIDDYITEEYQKEIYGVSFSASPNYNFIGNNYERILNYHAAHDIGHALQDKKLVPGCTAFGTWDSRTADSSLVLGRNFDFFVGEKFAEEKIVCFIKPDSGYKLMYVTWGGFTGVVSGMNEKGLTITLNASKSDVPTRAATPISVLAREILQYASNIKEAYAIAEKRQTFVSEAIMVGSAEDDKTYIIEKSPTKIGLLETTGNEISCSNHFQGANFKSQENIQERSSVYRYQRLQQLLKRYPEMDENKAALILRDQRGLDDKNIGMGNEKALNQLIAHHSVIFKPKQGLMWVSANPFQLGEYVCYDLNKVFANCAGLKEDKAVNEQTLDIPADSFLLSSDYQNFLTYKQYRKTLIENRGKDWRVKEPYIKEFENTNPEFYYTYWLIGDYYRFNEKDFATAVKYYEIALTKEVPRDNEIAYLEKSIRVCKEKQSKP